MKGLHIIAFILLIVGGLNWLLVAFGWNIVEVIFGRGIFSQIVYIVVGLAAVYEIVSHKKNCRACGSNMM